MALKQLDNSNISKHLGKSSEYACLYDKTLLVREPRASNRKHINLDDDNLPFIGTDTWNGYEVTGLLNNGLPVSCVVKFVYPCNSKYIVESKSLKLYFNSFSMTKLGSTVSDVYKCIEAIASKDLGELLECKVDVACFYESDLSTYMHAPGEEYLNDGVVVLEESVNLTDNITKYTEDPSLLKFDCYGKEEKQAVFYSRLLRSRCRVTSQPDSGDVLIKIKGNKLPTRESLLKYIISFRDECHFHEEICETIYSRLLDLLNPLELSVVCLYARRGGWDINPERISSSNVKHYCLSDVNSFHIKTPKQ
jgi:7-cyano-7-deazaguanine reductase